MLQSAKIKIRSLKELQADNINLEPIDIITTTPFKKRKKPSGASTTKKHSNQDEEKNENVLVKKAAPQTVTKLFKSALKELPPSQKRIDTFFKSCPKTYKIEKFEVEPPTPIGKISINQQKTKSKTKKNCTTTKKATTTITQRRPKTGRKRLFVEPEISTETETSCSYDCKKSISKTKMIDCIIIDSDSEDVPDTKNSNSVKSKNQLPTTLNNESLTTLKNSKNDEGPSTTKPQVITRSKMVSLKQEKITPPKSSTNENSSAKTSNHQQQQFSTNSSVDKGNTRKTSSPNSSSVAQQTSSTSHPKTKTPSQIPSLVNNTNTVSKRKSKPCPPYKIIEGTSFAVDAFQFGYIENVSHYFLTHFHADHYIGLTRSFAMPLYMSPITARLVRSFIPIAEEHINELELNVTYVINNIEVTALDANHCPGAVLLVFKFKNGKCILHTGDFRAWHGMESEPIFWNNDIHTIYLDTTYISDKYDFCKQHESIDKAINLIETFQEKHHDKRILYICGSYVIGKEKFWSSLAENFNMKVWTEGNRNKALKSIADKRFDRLLVDDPYKANMHVIAMAKLGYLHLVEYFSQYEQHYDIVFAIRPSGWEKKSKPQYRGKINIIGIEYSEHSSFSEMQRFVKFLKPQQVLSTVPTGRDLMVTAKIPQTWYKYDTLQSSSNYQPSIDTYFGRTPLKKNIRPPNLNKGGLENFVSPLSLVNKGQQNLCKIKNDDKQQVISINSSENEFEQELNVIKPKPSSASKQTEKNTRALRKRKSVFNENQNGNALKQENNILEIPIDDSKSPEPKKNTKLKKKSPKSRTKPPAKHVANTSFVTQNSSEDFEKPEILSTIKKNPLSKKTKSNLKTINENGSAIRSNIKKKLIFEEATKELPSTSRVTKLKYQEQTTIITTTSEEDFEMPHKSKRINLRKSNQINNLPSIKLETAKSITSSDNDIELQKTQKPHYEKQNSLIFTSNEEMEIPVSQRLRTNIQNSSKTIILKNIQQEKQIGDIQLSITKITKQQSSINPLLKSNTTSNCSSATSEIPESQIEQQTPRILRNNRNGLTQTSQTATSIEKSLEKKTLLKSSPTSNNSSLTDEIPVSQIKQETTQSLGNKINRLTQAFQTSQFPPNLSDDSLSTVKTPALHSTLKNNQNPKDPQSVKDKQQRSSTPFNTKSLLNEILYNNNDLDFYNSSQLVTIVEESLSKQCLDTSTDHIPCELLSDTDGEQQTSEFHLNLPDDSLSSDKTKALEPTLKNKQNLKNPLFKSSPASNSSSFTDEISEAKIKQETSPPLRNKRNGLTSASYITTPIKKAKEQQTSQFLTNLSLQPTLKNNQKSKDPQNVKDKKPLTPFNTKSLLNEIYNNNDVDFYNTSQMITIVEESLSKQCLDKSTDHIPCELLSDPDADDDWMN